MKRPFSLSPRLQAVAQLVPPGYALADVGTDHGRLPVWLIQHGVIPRAVASDLRPGPLSRAQELARRWDLSARLSFRLCDGLSGISPQEVQTITITGMGGETIADILAAAQWPKEADHQYILQPMSGADGLRRYLSDHGFEIRQEVLAPEGETLYLILLAHPGKMFPLSEGEIWVGRQRKGMDSPLRGCYLEQELRKLQWAMEGLGRSQNPQDVEKRKQFALIAQEVSQMKKEWEQWQLS